MFESFGYNFLQQSFYLVADHCGPKMLGRAEAAHFLGGN